MVTRSALTRSCCCSCRQSVLLLRRTRNWDMNTFNTHLITTWPADQSYVRSRTAEQCFFVFSEPKNHHQTEIEADPELGPGADATLWHRSREGIVRGQWPDSVDYVTVLFDWHVGWLLCDYCDYCVFLHLQWKMYKNHSSWMEEWLLKKIWVDVIPANLFYVHFDAVLMKFTCTQFTCTQVWK